ncbi:unnamed protein product, partial [Prunus brigantina]
RELGFPQSLSSLSLSFCSLRCRSRRHRTTQVTPQDLAQVCLCIFVFISPKSSKSLKFQFCSSKQLWLIKNQESVAHGAPLFGFFFSPYRIFDQVLLKVFDPTCHQPTPQQQAR